MDARLIRLIVDSPADGGWNMALDESLLIAVQQSGSPVLRFYRWSSPTLSLGYFQNLADRQQHAASAGCPVVRRPSGGGALIHDHEWTYSLAVPLRTRSLEAVEQLYDAVHGALVDQLRRLGIAARRWSQAVDRSLDSRFLCFQRRTPQDVVVSSAKILGSAQRKRFGVVLQHGGLLFRQSACAPELPGLVELAGRAVDDRWLIDQWSAAIADRLGLRLWRCRATTSERQRAVVLRRERFLNPLWTGKR